jgi:putative hydrolase
VFDFHIHSLFSDGELIPAEIARRYAVLGYRAVAITDHMDPTNMESILRKLVPGCQELNEYLDITLLPGAEITHVPPRLIGKMAKRARGLGAEVIVVHGETPAEPVEPGTNAAAVEIPEIDILAHPGKITEEEAEAAKENGIFLELTARAGHNATNGHVADVAGKVGAELIINTDAHSPDDIITLDDARLIGIRAGLLEKVSEIVTTVNPRRLLRKYK